LGNNINIGPRILPGPPDLYYFKTRFLYYFFQPSFCKTMKITLCYCLAF